MCVNMYLLLHATPMRIVGSLRRNIVELGQSGGKRLQHLQTAMSSSFLRVTIGCNRWQRSKLVLAFGPRHVLLFIPYWHFSLFFVAAWSHRCRSAWWACRPQTSGRESSADTAETWCFVWLMINMAGHDDHKVKTSSRCRSRQAEDSRMVQLSFLQHGGLRLLSVSTAILQRALSSAITSLAANIFLFTNWLNLLRTHLLLLTIWTLVSGSCSNKKKIQVKDQSDPSLEHKKHRM